MRLQPKFLKKWKKASEIGWDSLINVCHQIHFSSKESFRVYTCYYRRSVISSFDCIQKHEFNLAQQIVPSLASPQTSFGVRLSRIHEMNAWQECVPLMYLVKEAACREWVKPSWTLWKMCHRISSVLSILSSGWRTCLSNRSTARIAIQETLLA